MVVYIYENYTELNDWFKSPDYYIPFLATNLLNFMGHAFRGAAGAEDVRLYVPETWKPDLGDIEGIYFYNGGLSTDVIKRDYELFFVTSLHSLFIGKMDDVPFLKENPDKLYSNRGVIGGFLKKGQTLPPPIEFEGFSCFAPVGVNNYLRINQDLIANVSTSRPLGSTPYRVYGTPTIEGEVDSNSTVCGPSYIGKNVIINNSYIGPGSIIRGDSVISESQIFGSLVEGTKVTQTTLTDCIVAAETVSNVTLESSVLPGGTHVHGKI